MYPKILSNMFFIFVAEGTFYISNDTLFLFLLCRWHFLRIQRYFVWIPLSGWRYLLGINTREIGVVNKKVAKNTFKEGLCDYVKNNISHICLWPWFKVLKSEKHDRPPQAFNSTPFIAPGVDLVNPHFHLSYYKLGTESNQRNIVLSICFCHCVIYWSQRL